MKCNHEYITGEVFDDVPNCKKCGLLKSTIEEKPVEEVGSDSELKDLESLLKVLIDKSGIPCKYCGVPSTDKEHVTPISWIESAKELALIGIEIEVPKEVIVPSCRECNLLASDKIFNTFSEKRKYIKEKLYKRYKKLINSPEWTEKEILELTGNLKRHVFLVNEIKKRIKSRLKY